LYFHSDKNGEVLVEDKDFKKYLGIAANYCANRERPTSDVVNMLVRHNVGEGLAIRIVEWLKNEKFLDERRYCEAYVKDKFRFNKWGKIKLKYEMKKKGVDDGLIGEVLEQVPVDEYAGAIKELAEKKWRQLNDDNTHIKKQKTARYLINKGFEPLLVMDILNEIYG